MKVFKELNQVQILQLFEKLTGYGIYLLGDTIEAWQYNHEEDGSVLKDAFETVRTIKKYEEQYNLTKPAELTRKLKFALKTLSDTELDYLIKLLELDPRDVFINNPYLTNGYYDEEDYEEDKKTTEYSYDKICELVNKEKENRIKTEKESKQDMLKRSAYSNGNKSDVLHLRTNCAYAISKEPAVPNTDELFSKRYNKSKKLKRKKDGYRPYNI